MSMIERARRVKNPPYPVHPVKISSALCALCGKKSVDMNIKLHLFQDRDVLNSAAADLLASHLPRPGGIMLSGGNTPLAIYRQIHAGNIEATLFLSDERYVPVEDPRSNCGAIFPFFNAGRAECLPCFIKVNTALPIEAAAQAFHNDLSKIKQIPLGLLGLGTDGHTASLFNLKDAALRDERLAIPVIKSEKPDRISVTPALLNRIERILILATGKEKRDVIKTLLEKPETIPAGVALAGHPNIELWTDQIF